VLSALALMGVARALALLEADAFIAASFGSFTRGAQLAFLVFGPLADMKLTVLYGATFRRWFVGRLLLVTIPIVLIGSADLRGAGEMTVDARIARGEGTRRLGGLLLRALADGLD
jgi:uncharacterized membrane protein YraQ (UPF0718 family)